MKISIVHMNGTLLKSFSNRQAVPRVGDHLTMQECDGWVVKSVIWDALLESVTVLVE
jgi:hypothetical protein